jgi:hypothetical protein
MMLGDVVFFFSPHPPFRLISFLYSLEIFVC